MTDLPNGFTGFRTEIRTSCPRATPCAARGTTTRRSRRASRPRPQSGRGLVAGRLRARRRGRRCRGRLRCGRPWGIAFAVPAVIGGQRRAALRRAGHQATGAPRFDPDKLARIPETDRRWAWVEIDLNAIRHNASAVKRAESGTRLMAVVKADGYGHGAVQCAKTALNSGAEYLGVATVDEAIALREAYVNAPILILGEPPATAIPLLLAYKIMPAVYTAEFAIRYAEAADAFGVSAPFHLKVNTGMNRIGVRWDEVVEFARQISFHRALDMVGTFTHFATADCPGTIDFERQVKRFSEAVNALRAAGINPGIVHAANSAAAIRYPEVQLDMVRLGISLYGFYPCPEAYPMIDLKPAMSVKARITDVKTLPVGEGVSYGLNYRSPGAVKICTMPIGYADGFRGAFPVAPTCCSPAALPPGGQHLHGPVHVRSEPAPAQRP
ncbi:MAG: alanine racemase [Adlercreutzia equolifaciens]